MKRNQTDSTRRHPSKAVLVLITVALLANPVSTLADTIYVASYFNTIEKFTSDGAGTLFANTGFNAPSGIAFNTSGYLYVANGNDSRIQEFTPNGVGSPFANGGHDQGGMRLDTAGNLYVADQSDNTIHRFTPEGVGSIFASGGMGIPHDVVFDNNGNLYVSNGEENEIIKITPTGARSIFANIGLNMPVGLAFDSAGNLYAANFLGNTIEKYSPDGVGSLFAVTGSYPEGLAFDSAGNLYVANSGDNTIGRFTPSGVGSVFAQIPTPTFIAIIPEPATLSVFGLGFLLCVYCRKRGKAFISPNKSLQATRGGRSSSASRFTSFDPACLSSGR